MLCDHCKKNTATTHVKQTVNGVTTEMNLCAQCAAQQGLYTSFGNFGLDLGDFWGSLFAEPSKRTRDDSVRCPDCGRSFREIAECGKAGCPSCYLTFYDRLLPSIQRIHGKTQHTGKTAGKAEEQVKIEHQLAELKKELERCVTAQEYEECARLRDRIRALEEGGDVQ
ncbi:MAG: UvrB/UvrC motif-containing protein [Clostridia bacterium]|nr:UvrB/UvrC motif-containing protein [Clostridia bacterium]